MRFVQGDAHGGQASSVRPQAAILDPRRDAIKNLARQEFGSGIAASEFRYVIKITVAQFVKHRAQAFADVADIDYYAIEVQIGPAQFQIDDISCTMRALSGAKGFAPETVGNHEMVADADGVHSVVLGSIA